MKCRAKDILTDKWVYGVLIDNNIIRGFDGQDYTINVNTIGKGTGYPDKNGIECYEGDLIPYAGDETKLGIVKYGEYQNVCDNNIGFYVDWKEKLLNITTRKDLGFWLKISNISGTIHDNKVI